MAVGVEAEKIIAEVEPRRRLRDLDVSGAPLRERRIHRGVAFKRERDFA